MLKDEIIEETRKRREAYAAQFGYDLDAIVADLQKKQSESGKDYVSFEPRQSVLIKQTEEKEAA